MKAIGHTGPPPGYTTATLAVEMLNTLLKPLGSSMTKQVWQQSGLGGAVEWWAVGGGKYATRVYRQGDVDRLARWLVIRLGLIALGYLFRKAPLNPTEAQWAAVEAGHWDATCPACSGDAVGEGGRDRLWCPKCGIITIKSTKNSWSLTKEADNDH